MLFITNMDYAKYHHPVQSTHQPLKSTHQLLKSTTPPSSKNNTNIFKVPHHPLQSTTPPSSKYHPTLFKVPHNVNIRNIDEYGLCDMTKFWETRVGNHKANMEIQEVERL